MAAFWGALFAFVAYSTFHFTNKSILKDWSNQVILVDVLFGIFLTAFISLTTFMAYGVITNTPI